MYCSFSDQSARLKVRVGAPVNNPVSFVGDPVFSGIDPVKYSFCCQTQPSIPLCLEGTQARRIEKTVCSVKEDSLDSVVETYHTSRSATGEGWGSGCIYYRRLLNRWAEKHLGYYIHQIFI